MSAEWIWSQIDLGPDANERRRVNLSPDALGVLSPVAEQIIVCAQRPVLVDFARRIAESAQLGVSLSVSQVEYLSLARHVHDQVLLGESNLGLCCAVIDMGEAIVRAGGRDIAVIRRDFEDLIAQKGAVG